MSKTIYILCRHFTPNSGSYAGVFEEVSKYAFSRGYSVKILCSQVKKDLPLKEHLSYAEVIRFPIFKFGIPFIGMNKDYLSLGGKVKKYFKQNPPGKEDLFIANGRAALGILDKEFTLRMGQPARIFLKNMEIANNQVSIFTRAARKFHFSFQYFLEKKCVEKAEGYLVPSNETLQLIQREYGNEKKKYFIPQSAVKYDDVQGGKKTVKGRHMLFVSAGEEKIRKGVVYLEKALPEIFSKYPDVNLLHVGDKFEWDIPDKYKSRIVSVGRVPWDKMKDYYASSELLVSCAINEGMANTIFEAMATGTPIVSSDIEGIREYLSHKKDSYVFKRGEIDDLKSGISFILDKKKFRKEASKLLKAKAKKLSYDLFSEKLLYFINHKEDNKKNFNLLKND